MLWPVAVYALFRASSLIRPDQPQPEVIRAIILGGESMFAVWTAEHPTV